MATLINFESAREKNKKREEIREARQQILQQAKQKYEKEEKRKEQARLRGEDTWMLPSINQRIEQDEQYQEKTKSKKHKKEKKKKKHKEKKKKKKRDDSSDSSSDDEAAMWVEKTEEKSSSKQAPVVKGPRMERDSWMEEPLDLVPTISRQDILEKKRKNKEEADKQKNMLDQPGMHSKELNPYWKDGGTGLPEEKKSESKPVSTGIGDGGLSWLRKSYQRCVEQAKQEGRRLEDLAAERWGSLDKIHRMLREAESLSSQSSRGKKPRYGDRGGSQRNRFIRPATDDRNNKNSGRRSRSHSRSPKRHSSKTDKGRRSSSPNYRKEERQRHSNSSSWSSERQLCKRRSRSRERSDSHDRNRRRSRSVSSDSSSSSSSSQDRKRRRSRSKSSGRNRSRSRSRSRERLRTGSSRDDQSSSLRGRFMRPGDSETTGRTRNQQSSSSSSSVSAHRGSSDRVPAWKKASSHKPVESSRVENDAKRVERKKQEVSSSDSESESEDTSDESSDGQQHMGQSSKSDAVEVKVLTEKEMNELGAKIVKAEILGNTEQANKLKAQLEAAREARKQGGPGPAPQGGGGGGGGGGGRMEEEVVLTRTDRSGLSRPVPERQHPVEPKGGRRKKQNVSTHTGGVGERTKYFDDDDKFDLKTLVEREKMGTAEDQNQMFSRLAGRSTEKTNDDFQVDDVFLSKANRKQSASVEEERDRAKAVFEHKKMASALDKCQFCFGNVPKHLIVAIGTKVYLCLPNHQSLAEGHCVIVPMQHVTSATAMDEDVWSEIQVFRKCLTRMFSERDEDVVFMETSMGVKRFPHMSMECIPMEKEVGDMAPVYFKKALLECESEWAQNKKVVDISQKDIRHSVPKGFPYFAVDFGLQGGFAHVIEDEQSFPNYFGREIIGGMIDAEPRLWRKPRRENFDDQRKKVMKFAEMWKPYDWTQKLAQAEDSDD